MKGNPEELRISMISSYIKFHDKTSVKELSHSCSQSCHGLCLLLNLMTAHVTDAWMPVAFEAKANLAQSDRKVYHPVHTFAHHNFLRSTKLRVDGKGPWQIGSLFTCAFTRLLERREYDVHASFSCRNIREHTCQINMPLRFCVPFFALGLAWRKTYCH